MLTRSVEFHGERNRGYTVSGTEIEANWQKYVDSTRTPLEKAGRFLHNHSIATRLAGVGLVVGGIIVWNIVDTYQVLSRIPDPANTPTYAPGPLKGDK